jgi:hypothetical protein
MCQKHHCQQCGSNMEYARGSSDLCQDVKNVGEHECSSRRLQNCPLCASWSNNPIIFGFKREGFWYRTDELQFEVLESSCSCQACGRY